MNGVPDKVFVEGAVYTCDAAASWASAFAVENGTISAVGSTAEIRALAGPGTEVVDLEGHMVLPGFTDAHVHPVNGGLEMLRCNLLGLATATEYVDAVRTYAHAHPGASWIQGGGWSFDAFPGGIPRAADLDRACSDRPVVLYNRDHHTAWVNTRAMEIAGIDRDTADPPVGSSATRTGARAEGCRRER